MNTGVVTDPSFGRLERAAAHAFTTGTLPVNAAACTGSSVGSRRSGGIEPARPATRPDFDEPLRHQCGVEIGPRLDRDHGRPRDAGHERVEDRSAPVGDAPGADLRVGDVGPRGEPVEHLPRVRDLPRPVDADEPAGLPVPSCVEGEDCVSARERRIALDQRVHLLAVARDAVEEDDGRPAARRWGAVREVESRGERDAVVRRDRDVLLGRDRAVCIAGDEDECRRERGEQGLHHGAQGSPSGHGRCLTPCLTPGASRSAASGV